MDNIELIPISVEADNNTRAKFTKNKALDSPEKFITLYNMKLLTKNNEIIKDLVQSITDTYRNTKTAGSFIIIESLEETAISTISALLEQWTIIAALKRMAQSMLEDGYDSESLVYFKEDEPGWPLIRLEGQDSFERHWTAQKVANSHEDIVSNFSLGNIIKKINDDGSLVGFSLYDLSTMDLNFILELKDFISDTAVE